jgi:predicted dehydrogenase
MKYKILIVGLGSMGKRRLRILKGIDKNANIVGVDSRSDRRKETEKLFEVRTFENLDSVSATGYEKGIAFVCTHPLFHEKIIYDCLKKNFHIFTELNLVSDGYEKNIALAKEKNLMLFLSSTLLYRKEIDNLKKKISGKRVAYSYHSGQYLPSWHPYENINDFFVSEKRTNGVREIMAIDFPFLEELFSEFKEVSVMSANLSSLKLNFPDTLILNVKHKNGTLGSIAVDIITKGGVRDLSVFGEDMLYKLKWEEDGEKAYKREILNFFQCVGKKAEPKWSFEKDAKLLKFLDKIERPKAK